MKFNALLVGAFFAAFIILFTAEAHCQTYTFKTVHDFTGTDGSDPSSLIQDTLGNLYGTTSMGGKFGAGTIFKIGPRGNESTLHSFNGTMDGSGPNSLIRDAKTGTLYGTTDTTIFKMTTGRAPVFTVLVTNDHVWGFSDALLDSRGNLFGIDHECLPFENPCVWEIPVGGQWKDIFDFGDSESYSMDSNLIIDRSGKVYVGSSIQTLAFDGWVQQIGGSDNTFGPVEVFTNSLRQDAGGNIYSFAYGDDSSGTLGTIFKESPLSQLSILYTFTDGSQPVGPFSLDKSGNIFGTTSSATVPFGVDVFELKPNGVPDVIYSSTDINTGLIMDATGNLYGTTFLGKNGFGSVWKLTKGK